MFLWKPRYTGKHGKVRIANDADSLSALSIHNARQADDQMGGLDACYFLCFLYWKVVSIT
jgi:hypothetical protein